MITIEMAVATYDDTINMEIGASYSMSSTDPFDGLYEYTPSAEVQTIPINGLRATDDIVIQPIPSNYGLITWDGSAITVS